MNHLICKIIEVKGDEVEVEIQKHKITLPKEYFPQTLTDKDEFQLFLFNPKYPNLNEKHLAKSILEEILNGK